MSPVSNYLTRPLRSEEQARREIREREAAETFAAPRGLADGIGSAVAIYAAMGTVIAWLVS